MTEEDRIGEIEKRHAEIGTEMRAMFYPSSDIAFLLSALRTRDRRIKELEEGLRPFANFNIENSPAPDSQLIADRGYSSERRILTVGDLRRACRALLPVDRNDIKRDVK